MISAEAKERIDIPTLLFLVREVGWNRHRKRLSTKEKLLAEMKKLTKNVGQPEMTEDDLDFYINTLVTLSILGVVGRKVDNVYVTDGWDLTW